MAIIFDTKRGKKAKAANNHVYSGFWLDKDATSLGDMFHGKNSTTVKALKLRKYQRAIANFVKILAQRDVPVVFKGTESYTDNEHVVLATDINDKNFDVSAGLALHEASHLKYTDFDVLKGFMGSTFDADKAQRVKEILNYVEDRRIDNLVFKSSPGYKAYYHKLYDHYFRNDEMANVLMQYRQPEWESYMAQMIGMLHPKFNVNALPGLRQIAAVIDINNIGRLQNTAEALQVALSVYDIMSRQIAAAEQQAQQQESGEGEEDQEQPEGQGQGTESKDGSESNDGSGEQEETQGGSEGEDSEAQETEMPELTPQQERAMREALREAKNMTNGKVDKKQAANSLVNKLKNIQDAPVDYSPVGNEFGKSGFDCIIHELYKQPHAVVQYHQINEMPWSDRTGEHNTLRNKLYYQLPGCINSSTSSYQDKMVTEGFQLGAILGRKLLTRREVRSLEQNRLRSGKIDSKRIAAAGYGIETIFNQIHIDKFKKANIHLTIDSSGSMSGKNWYNSMKLAATLGKAVSMIDGLELQISTRDTDGHSPEVAIIYDSRVNKIQYLEIVLRLLTANSMTPEGLCLEGLLNKKILIPTTAECDSYLINICDGQPGFDNYQGERAVQHTARTMKRINTELGIKHIGYFFGSAEYGSFKTFQRMYGEKTSVAMPDASNAMQIADTMNRQLMSK